MSNINSLVKLDESMVTNLAKQDPVVAQVLVLQQSGLYPEMKDIAVAMTKAWAGKELGIGPAVSQKAFHKLTINNKTELNMWTKYLAALAQKRGYYWHEMSANLKQESHLVFFHKKRGKLGVWKFTREDAASQGLLNRDVWKKHTATMIAKSCLRGGLSHYAPEIFVGGINGDVIIDEPLDDVDNEPEPTFTLVEEEELTSEEIQERGEQATDELCGSVKESDKENKDAVVKPKSKKKVSESSESGDEPQLCIGKTEQLAIFDAATKAGMTKGTLKKHVIDFFNKDKTSDLNHNEYKFIVDVMLPKFDKEQTPEKGTVKFAEAMGGDPAQANA